MFWAMIASMGALAAQSSAPDDSADDRCPAPFEQMLADKVFRAYPAPVPTQALRPAAPDVRKGSPHLFRTVIREQAKLGPNFAGHYTIIHIGCGAGTTCVAIVDANTGKVSFPPLLRSAELLLKDTGNADIAALTYKRDSRLIVVMGVPNENLRDEGASYYVWRAGQLKRVRFIPVAKLCGPG